LPHVGIRVELLTQFRSYPVLRNSLNVISLHAMELSHSREANSRSATQKLANVSLNSKVQYRVRKSPPLIPILSQINPVHITPFYSSQINLNIILSPTSRSSYWSLCFWISHQCPICNPLFPCVLHALSISSSFNLSL
jgi:hypothetical protein